MNTKLSILILMIAGCVLFWKIRDRVDWQGASDKVKQGRYLEIIDVSNAPKAKSDIYPFSRTISDTQGRAIRGTILGKSGSTIGVRRTSDIKEFVVDLSTLQKKDQDFFSRKPDGNQFELDRINQAAD